MPPLKHDLGRARIHLEHLPREGGHHALEGLVRGLEGAVCGAVELVRGDEGVVGADFEHVLGGLGLAAVDRELVARLVDGAPVVKVHLVAGFDLPVLDQLLDQVGQGAGGVGAFLGWNNTRCGEQVVWVEPPRRAG